MEKTVNPKILFVGSGRESTKKERIFKAEGFEVIRDLYSRNMLNTLRDKSIDLIVIDFESDLKKNGILQPAEIIRRVHPIPVLFIIDENDSAMLHELKEIPHSGIIPNKALETILTEALKPALTIVELQKEKKNNSNKFGNLFNSMSQGVVYHNSNGEIIAANPAAEEILGLSYEQMIGRESTDPRWRAIHEDGSDYPGDTHPAMIALERGEKVERKIMGVFHPPKEDYVWICVSAVPEYREDCNKPYQVFATFEDITARKLREEERRKNQKFLENVFDSIQEFISIQDKDLRVKRVNHKVRDLYKDKLPLEGRICYKVYHERSEPCINCPTIRAIQTKTVQSDTISAVIMNGERRWFELLAYPVLSIQGEVESVIEYAKDITEQKNYTRQIEHHNSVLNTLKNVKQLSSTELEERSYLNAVCAILQQGGGYDSALIILFDENNQYKTSYHSGFRKDFSPFESELRKGNLPECCKLSIKQDYDISVLNPRFEEGGCIIKKETDFANNRIFSAPLHYNSKLYGVICTSIHSDFSQNEEEQVLFKDVAQSIAHTLYRLEIEKEKNQINAQLKLHEYITNTINSPMAFISTDYTYRMVNKAYSEYYGIPRAKILGMTVKDLVGAGLFADEVKQHLDYAIQGESVSFDIRVKFPEKGMRFMRMHYAPYFERGGSEVEGIVAFGIDMTEQKALEDQMVSSKTRLDLALRAAKMGIWDWHVDSGKVQWEGEHASLYGISDKEFGGTIDDVQRCVHPEDRNQGMEVFKRTLEENQPFDNIYRVIWPDGSIHWMYSFGNLICNHEGKPWRILGTTQDITSRKRNEERIKGLLDEKELLLKEIHHRVKNNMAIISSFLSIRSQSIASPEAKRALTDAKNRVASIQKLYDRLTYSESYKTIEVDSYLNILIQEIMKSYGRKNIGIESDIENLSIDIKTTVSLGIIVNELVTNAIKYAFTKKDSGTIYIGLNNYREDEYNLIIRDNGRGTDKANTDKSGFGLNLVKALVRQLEGTFTVESSQDKGTEYSIFFKSN